MSLSKIFIVVIISNFFNISTIIIVRVIIIKRFHFNRSWFKIFICIKCYCIIWIKWFYIYFSWFKIFIWIKCYNRWRSWIKIFIWIKCWKFFNMYRSWFKIFIRIKCWKFFNMYRFWFKIFIRIKCRKCFYTYSSIIIIIINDYLSTEKMKNFSLFAIWMRLWHGGSI